MYSNVRVHQIFMLVVCRCGWVGEGGEGREREWEGRDRKREGGRKGERGGEGGQRKGGREGGREREGEIERSGLVDTK